MDEFEALYRRHAAAIFRFAWGLTGDRGAAEDLVSETFVRVLTRAPAVRAQTALAYLLTIARNLHVSDLRRRRREVPLPDDTPAYMTDPETAASDRLQLQAVRRALADFPEIERTALLMRVDHDLSYEDIAVALDISVSAAKVRVHRARLHLARALAPKGMRNETGRDT